MMRPIHLRHAVLYDVANCLIDLFPSGADVAEIGHESAPALFVSWRTGGVANHPGNIAWGVHYRFDAQVLRDYPHLPEAARDRVCERVRDMSRLLDFNYADPLASSLLVVDVDESVLAA
ncbi:MULTISPECIES: hypothetical protein [Caballeronia]|uniref:Uncharacterized protein n=1 Tax=Caballeronia cordobensis TaxID=1353886 RepID=A0A158FTD1_CABCO|nr:MULTISPECIES: hypothetical protein [Caballeronia]AET88967.1 hypothetical protein BYI23_A011290 [Burkholderia sp. YI23]AQG98482.1 hypothetical protein A9R05_06285 [Burkholderia sp. KK1]BAO86221.1 putative uncharacterized protein [Burkholderia sp. RPE67]MCE4541993.1 hypothetical protein [Caballeronia sp. PC1]MCE4568961.1 hypothetical protein [Caballeronia sp. CLC5]